MIKALIVDDEEPARQELRYYIERDANFTVCGEAAGGSEALELASFLQPDVVFLDIELWDLDGVEVARLLLKQPRPPLIIFATAYDAYAIEAFELNAVDYLLKPFTAERVATTLARVRQLLQQHETPPLASLLRHLATTRKTTKVAAWKEDRLLVIDPGEIIYAEARGHQVLLKTNQGALRFPGTLQELEDKLDRGFLRVHRSFIVNLDLVREVVPYFHGTYHLLLKDQEKTEIPVGRTYLKDVRTILGF
ncbi:LytR/AlgR family response regulator transcription factor [Neomoorella mulderi]|uniref:Stage 0 sporulation protein A homolog n=1 Tax=Moorella mulderi DSM 14980 TaxID=1122241 RepID=A0A151B0T4_9FIRM|nr:LytTR family DNA-binding domain-containing protein [Moorella mulderi]KYH33521.1 transcriptional regulatory protein YpdB [Moorella mulderi DSM 14980]